MITGTVEKNHAILPVTFRTDSAGDIVAKFVVDTGYTGLLTLPPRSIAALGLELTEDMEITLADESKTTVNVFAGVIVWHSVEKGVAVLEIDSRPLLGAGLLRGNRLCIDFAEDGGVSVEPLNL